MIIKFILARVSIIFFLVILLPLVQKQWLNLYLFNIDDFTIYKILYYISGLIVPILVSLSSLDKFTYYKFSNHKNDSNNYISGKLLLVLTLIILSILSILTSHYIFINFKIFLDLFLSNNDYLIQFLKDKQLLIIIVIFTFFLFKKTKFIVKKIILTNYFLISIFSWYSHISNSFLIEVVPFHIFKLENINFINIVFLLAIEISFFLWAYISYSTYLSDWNVPKPYKKDLSPIFNIVIFYLLIILYYSILFK